MVTKFLNKITLISQNTNILILGTLTDELTNTIDKYFHRKECIEFNEETIEILNDNLYSQYDLIVFSFTRESFEMFSKSISAFPKNSVVVVESKIYCDLEKYINTITSLVILPINEESFGEKLYNVLSINETNKLLKSKEKIINKYKDDETNTNINEFLDKYHGSIMFLNDDLNENCNRLKDLEVSEELFKEISTNVLKLNGILKYNKSFTKLSATFEQLSDFLTQLDLSSISAENYSAFDYLTTIVEDITIYLDELFVYKLFKDVHVFEDSLENNIKYFEDSLCNKIEEDDDNLEFF